MKQVAHIPFLQEKISVLQATCEFAFQLRKARNSFDYGAALKTIGNKAVGMKYFYERSRNLVNWICIHSAFSGVLKRHKATIRSTPLGHASSNLTTSFLLLQQSALELLGMLNDSLEQLERENATAGLRWNVRNDWIEHKNGIDILRTIINTKPEQYWIDLYEQGFKSTAS